MTHNPACAVCGEPSVVVCNGAFGAYSNAYCPRCLAHNAEPIRDIGSALSIGLTADDMSGIFTLVDGKYITAAEYIATGNAPLEPGTKVRDVASGDIGFVQPQSTPADDLARRGLVGVFYLVNFGCTSFVPGWEAGRWMKPAELDVQA